MVHGYQGMLIIDKKTRFRQLLHNGKQFTLKQRNLNKTRLPYFLEYSFKYCSLEFVPYIYKFYYSIKRRKMITYGLFKSSKFGSLIIFQCHYPWHQSLIFHWSVLLVRSDSTLTWQGGDKRNRRRQEGWEGGGDYFKYIFLKGAIILVRRIIEGRLLFEKCGMCSARLELLFSVKG